MGIRAAALLLLLAATPAAAVVRTLFVGIDEYRYTAGKPGNTDPNFHDLHGPVNDVAAIRAVLAGPRWQLDLGRFDPASPCPAFDPTPPLSLTLVNGCASRAAIIGSLTAQITASKPGDTLLFFYSGHGSQSWDPQRLQPGQKNSTLVPADARGGGVHDILDSDLGRLIAAANARGVNVVTLFDACNSGTMTRDLRGGVARSIPAETVGEIGADIAPPPPLRGVTPGYRVHLSAAADGQSAIEIPSDSAYHGVFTTALVSALGELDAPAYADVAADVRHRLTAEGAQQTPGSEGATRTAFLGSSRINARIFAATVTGPTTVTIGEGTLAGVTPGSTYALYPDAGAAARNGPPLASGTVVLAGPGDATVTLTMPVDAAALPRPSLRETVHAYGAARLNVRVDGSPGQRARAAAALESITAIAISDRAPAYVLAFERGRVALRDAATGATIGAALREDAELDAALTRRGRALAKHFSLLALASEPLNPRLRLKLSWACADPAQRPPLATVRGDLVAPSGAGVRAAMVNVSGAPRFAYLLYAGGDMTIQLLSSEPAPMPDQSARDFIIRAGDPGRDQLLLMMTDRAVDLSSLEQDGLTRGIEGAPDSLQALLQNAGNGGASRGLTPVAAWDAVAVTLTTIPAKGVPPCAPPVR